MRVLHGVELDQPVGILNRIGVHRTHVFADAALYQVGNCFEVLRHAVRCNISKDRPLPARCP